MSWQHRDSQRAIFAGKTMHMDKLDWADEFSVAITVSDTEGKILYMNEKSALTFKKYGGRDLIGTNLRNCHKPESWDKITEIMNSSRSNCYTIEKEGVKKLIFQAPWFDNGTPAGLVELSVEIPFELDHFIRK